MKKFISLIIITLSVSFALTAQKVKSGNNPVGNWKFEAPYAPEGYNTGIINVSFAENKYSTFISFTGSDYKIPCEKFKFENDLVNFSVTVDSNVVSINLKMENPDKMTGKATYSEGEIPLSLTRQVQ